MRASKIMQERVKNTPNITIHWNTETVEILGENETEAIRVKNNENGSENIIPVKGFFVAIGHQPNTTIFEKWLKMDSSGYLIPQAGSSKTEIPGVFVSGDAADKVYRQAITAAGTGCMAALDAERYLVENGIS